MKESGRKKINIITKSLFFWYNSNKSRYLSAKYEFASSNTTRTTFAFDVCFVWKLAPLADEQNGFFIENPSRHITNARIKHVLGLQ
jgi:hypothetical protein